MAAKLRALAGGDDFPLEDFNLVGRGEEATVRLHDSGVSRQHATIRREGTHFWLVDLGSANGSFVNDMALTTARVLKDGDRLQFGASIFRFDQDDGAHAHDVTGMKTQVLKRNPIPVRTTQATMLVGDLKGFTHLTSQISAEQVAELLREWYSDCNTIMKQHGAMIDKFIGDCVFAYWPAMDNTTRGHAIEAARALRSADMSTSPMRKLLLETKNIVLDCRIGLHVGEVALGTMGKGINTALGDAVNLVFRIESLTRKTDKEVLASAAFLEGYEDAHQFFDPCGRHEVKGHPEMLEVLALKM